eukprot:TRINITY_DN31047_c0_g1_i1.p1 TRINITY_DN31047_c0_g1~~TRINITY_DN31047_c0_g1_i1.p1  ORF type:complete len:563 (+),score=168.81 TRINITY_DN31047_c0_g1_i1:63-1691(+)
MRCALALVAAAAAVGTAESQDADAAEWHEVTGIKRAKGVRRLPPARVIDLRPAAQKMSLDNRLAAAAYRHSRLTGGVAWRQLLRSYASAPRPEAGAPDPPTPNPPPRRRPPARDAWALASKGRSAPPPAAPQRLPPGPQGEPGQRDPFRDWRPEPEGQPVGRSPAAQGGSAAAPTAPAPAPPPRRQAPPPAEAPGPPAAAAAGQPPSAPELAADPPAEAAAQVEAMADLLGRHCSGPEARAPEGAQWSEMRRRKEDVERRILGTWGPREVAATATLLKREIASRCRRFFNASRYPHKSLVFTHIPKTGGQSLQAALGGSAQRHNVRDISAGHIRYGDVLHGPNKKTYFGAGREADFMTIFRDPVSLIISNYHYIRRNPTHGSHKRMLEMTLDEHLERDHDDGTSDGVLALFSQATRANRSVEDMRGLCNSARLRKLPHRCLCSSLWHTFLLRMLRLLAQRYTVVGVLERLPETLEVARCRIPWTRDLQVPHNNVRPPSQRKTPDRYDPALMRRKTFILAAVYRAVNRILDEDVKCCRAAAAR